MLITLLDHIIDDVWNAVIEYGTPQMQDWMLFLFG